jgi:hypothetical protein
MVRDIAVTIFFFVLASNFESAVVSEFNIFKYILAEPLHFFLLFPNIVQGCDL